MNIKELQTINCHDVVMPRAGVGLGHSTFTYIVRQFLADTDASITVLNPRQSLTTNLIWWAFNQMYMIGSKGGNIQKFYEKIRNHSNEGKTLLLLCQYDVSKILKEYTGTIVADHAYVSEKADFLLHGDVAADKTVADFQGTILAPAAAVPFLIRDGHPQEKIVDVGFFIPRIIQEQTSEDIDAKIKRIRDGKPQLLFMGSGASPSEHYQILHDVILPKLQGNLSQDGPRLIIYTGTNRNEARKAYIHALKLGYVAGINNNLVPNWQVQIIYGNTQDEAIEKSFYATRFSDVIFTMMNERMGLGTYNLLEYLPPIGINAKANTRYAVEHGITSRNPVNTDILLLYLRQAQFMADEFERRIEKIQKNNLLSSTGGINSSGIIYEAVQRKRNS